MLTDLKEAIAIQEHRRMLNSGRLGLNLLSAVLYCVMLNVRSKNARASGAPSWSTTDSVGAATADPQDGSENAAWSEQRLAPELRLKLGLGDSVEHLALPVIKTPVQSPQANAL